MASWVATVAVGWTNCSHRRQTVDVTVNGVHRLAGGYGNFTTPNRPGRQVALSNYDIRVTHMELRWGPNLEVSAFHAAWVLDSDRRLLDPVIEETLRQKPAELMSQLARSWDVPPSVFWRQLFGLAADAPNPMELARRLNSRLHGGAIDVGHIAGPLSLCIDVFRQRYPKALDELQLRSGPMQEAWEARGPGLLAMMQRLTDDEFLVESAGVLLVQPMVGGDGLSHIYANRVHMEAVLTNIEPRLPETLRLAWLLGQLNLDRPIYSERVHGHALVEVAELALMPLVLAAAEEVELAQLTPASLQLTLEHWTHAPEDRRENLAEVLMAWWETGTDGHWDWSTRLAALHQMLK